MGKDPVTTKAPAAQVVKDIRRTTRKQPPSDEKIRIVLSVLRGEDNIAVLCRNRGIAQAATKRSADGETGLGSRKVSVRNAGTSRP